MKTDKEYIPPIYESDEEPPFDGGDDDVCEDEETISEEQINEFNRSLLKQDREEKINKSKNIMSDNKSPFGPAPGTTTTWQQTSTPFGASNNNNQQSQQKTGPIWGNPIGGFNTGVGFNQQSPWNNNNNSTPFGNSSPWNSWQNNNNWNNRNNNNNQQQQQNIQNSIPQGQSQAQYYYVNGVFVEPVQINRDKDIIVCDFLDCVAETFQSHRQNHTPGLFPRGVFDLLPRFDVWDKLKAFYPERIFVLVPESMLRSSFSPYDNAWVTCVQNMLNGLSQYTGTGCVSFIYNPCEQRRETILNQLFNHFKDNIDKSRVVQIGIYSGINGTGDRDKRSSENCGIDFVDLNRLLTSMY